MSFRDYNFKVETVEAGQRRAYGDSYFHFIVTNDSDINFDEIVIKRFCTNFLRPTSMSVEKRNKHQAEKTLTEGMWFSPYYTSFKKIDERVFEYKVTEPSTH